MLRRAVSEEYARQCESVILWRCTDCRNAASCCLICSQHACQPLPSDTCASSKGSLLQIYQSWLRGGRSQQVLWRVAAAPSAA